ncbi:MAG: T9SS type A sorting domain-containing protein [Bacteroidia bacterium]|nr:T9SS type A sorting domain-containing protein [Bacteroidia bacterium]
MSASVLTPAFRFLLYLLLCTPIVVGAQSFTAITGTASPLYGLDVGDRSAPAALDIDHDGDLDLIAGRADGKFVFYRNNGSATTPLFALVTGAASPVNGLDVGNSAVPAFQDINADADLDLFGGGQDGFVKYYRNEGTASAATFVLRVLANPLNGIDFGAGAAPGFTDLDADGDLDCVVGESDGTLNAFQHTGTAAAPVFTALTGAANPFNGIDVGFYSTPFFSDLDGDGDPDAVIGNRTGTLRYYENTGTPSAAVFTLRNGGLNPFNGIDIGNFSVPCFADLDHDGDEDLIIGQADGAFSYYQNTLINFPVEFLGFEAVQVRQVVQLTWQTASELNNEGFTVMRSMDGRIWERLGFVPGHGTTTEVQSYDYQDNRLVPGQVYYRLEQRDLDGTTSFSGTIALYVEPVAAAVSIYPNPAPDKQLVIQIFSSTDDRATISIFDMAGRTVYQQYITLQGGTAFVLPADLRALPPGLYRVMVLMDDQPHMVQIQLP